MSGVARAITEAFNTGNLRLQDGGPVPGWEGMPEFVAVKRLRSVAASAEEVRAFTTLVAALDRARDADRLWSRAAELFLAQRWVFSPHQVVTRRRDVAALLRASGVSQRHTRDSAGWLRIATSLVEEPAAPVAVAVREGRGNVGELLHALHELDDDGRAKFPFLRGPKVSVMWIRMLSFPGGAHIIGLRDLPVAVDVQVRRVTENLGVAPTSGLRLDDAVRLQIQRAWAADIADGGCVGPGDLESTAAAADPVIWFFGKWGCTRCEDAGRKMPVIAICERCRIVRH